MKVLFGLLVIGSVLGSVATANASAGKLECSPVTDLKPADDGFKLVEIHRPKVDAAAPFDKIFVQVYEDPALARQDVADQGNAPWVVGAVSCDHESQVGYHVEVEHEADFDKTAVPLPVTAKGVKIKACSTAAQKCWVAIFDGDFNKAVELKDGDIASHKHNNPLPVLEKKD